MKSGTFTREQGTSDCRIGAYRRTETVFSSYLSPNSCFSAFLLKALIYGCYFNFESTYNKSVQTPGINVIITL
jgi:hypothetical protein